MHCNFSVKTSDTLISRGAKGEMAEDLTKKCAILQVNAV